jgi:uncharacterized glyoxalase superfamily metalloenzyme YdcJ
VTVAIVEQWELRAEFARRLSALYGEEVPAYRALLDVTQSVNRDVLSKQGADAERLRSIERVSAERHGAIRVGTPAEMAQVARIFAAMGMYPVGFYDLREAAASAVPVVSTAFRPVDDGELARSPFRVFASMLVPSDRRFFTADLQRRLETFLRSRHLFCAELLRLADRAATYQGLHPDDAELFLVLATTSFKLSSEPVDRAWYEELHAVSSVAADIGAITRTHINHLTPRVLDIDELYRRMSARGIEMIDDIQGPPRWKGPDLLLRQTSFRALAERRVFREADGRITSGDLRVRFGEVEARGIAVTPAGRALYDELTHEAEQVIGVTSSSRMTMQERDSIAAGIWHNRVPGSEKDLAAYDLAYFTYRVDEDRKPRRQPPGNTLSDLLDQNWVIAQPIVYEDFLPKSAAGIFQSNLTSQGHKDGAQPTTEIDASWMEGVLDRQLHDPHDLYASIRRRSLATVAARLGIRGEIEIPTTATATEGHLQ